MLLQAYFCRLMKETSPNITWGANYSHALRVTALKEHLRTQVEFKHAPSRGNWQICIV